jgi:hypothetical protein
MKMRLYMPKDSSVAVFYGLFKWKTEDKLETYVVECARKGNKLRGYQVLGRFLRYGEPANGKERIVENPAGFGNPQKSKFVFEPMQFFCPHTATVTAAFEQSLNPKLLSPMKEETMRHIKSQARKAYVNNGGLKSAKVLEIPGTAHFFEVRRKNGLNLEWIIDTDGDMVAYLNLKELADPSSKTYGLARRIMAVQNENGVYCFSVKISEALKSKLKPGEANSISKSSRSLQEGRWVKNFGLSSKR